jgi:hypothetical protein
LLLAILRSGWLTHAPHVHEETAGSTQVQIDSKAKIEDNQTFVPTVVCFCDIPLSDLSIHMRKYSRFGIAFTRPFLVGKGATPVFYVAQDAAYFHRENRRTNAEWFNICMKDYFVVQNAFVLQKDPDEFSKRVAHVLGFLTQNVFSFVKLFDSTKADDDPDNFYMEREWRVPGNVSFSLGDVRRVIIPESFASRFRHDLPEYEGQLHFAES